VVRKLRQTEQAERFPTARRHFRATSFTSFQRAATANGSCFRAAPGVWAGIVGQIEREMWSFISAPFSKHAHIILKCGTRQEHKRIPWLWRGLGAGLIQFVPV